MLLKRTSNGFMIKSHVSWEQYMYPTHHIIIHPHTGKFTQTDLRVNVFRSKLAGTNDCPYSVIPRVGDTLVILCTDSCL